MTVSYISSAVWFILLLTLAGCKRQQDHFSEMDRLSSQSAAYLRTAPAPPAESWRQFSTIFPQTRPLFSIHPGQNGVTLVWASLSATTNDLNLTFAIPLYLKGEIWTNRTPRWTAAGRKMERGIPVDWTLDLDEAQWIALQENHWNSASLTNSK